MFNMFPDYHATSEEALFALANEAQRAVVVAAGSGAYRGAYRGAHNDKRVMTSIKRMYIYTFVVMMMMEWGRVAQILYIIHDINITKCACYVFMDTYNQ